MCMILEPKKLESVPSATPHTEKRKTKAPLPGRTTKLPRRGIPAKERQKLTVGVSNKKTLKSRRGVELKYP